MGTDVEPAGQRVTHHGDKGGMAPGDRSAHPGTASCAQVSIHRSSTVVPGCVPGCGPVVPGCSTGFCGQIVAGATDFSSCPHPFECRGRTESFAGRAIAPRLPGSVLRAWWWLAPHGLMYPHVIAEPLPGCSRPSRGHVPGCSSSGGRRVPGRSLSGGRRVPGCSLSSGRRVPRCSIPARRPPPGVRRRAARSRPERPPASVRRPRARTKKGPSAVEDPFVATRVDQGVWRARCLMRDVSSCTWS